MCLIGDLTFRYNKSPAQILIRWSLQRGFVCIPKSVKEERIIENGDIFDFTISDEDMATMVSNIVMYVTMLNVATFYFIRMGGMKI